MSCQTVLPKICGYYYGQLMTNIMHDNIEILQQAVESFMYEDLYVHKTVID
jgi:hypothetical protein